MKLVILDGHCLNPGDLSWAALEQLADIEVFARTADHEVVERAAGAQIVLTNKTPLSAAALAQLPDLRFIGVLATGYNIVDVAAARSRGIVVSNIPSYGTASVAQFAIALLLELCHRVGWHSWAVTRGDWSQSPDWSFWLSPLVELSGKTLGVVGFGRIGRQTAAVAHALGMRIFATDMIQANAPDFPGFEWLSLDRLLAEADVVSLHCPLTADNKGMINRARLATMKRSAFLINTSRGALIVDKDLAGALEEGLIAGAALDVVSLEPPPPSNPLLHAKNCIVTPHIAWATKEARTRLLDIAVENVRAFLAGMPQNTV